MFDYDRSILDSNANHIPKNATVRIRADVIKIIKAPTYSQLVVVPFLINPKRKYRVFIHIDNSTLHKSQEDIEILNKTECFMSIDIEARINDNVIPPEYCDVFMSFIRFIQPSSMHTVNLVQYCEECGRFHFIYDESSFFPCCFDRDPSRTKISHTPLFQYYANQILINKGDITMDNKLATTSIENKDALTKAQSLIDQVKKNGGSAGSLSDGYHTFDELYHHRALLFASLCTTTFKHVAWKSLLHDDPKNNPMYPGMFIVGIETPEGQATYHYDIDPYWNMFKVKEVEHAPKYDGHTPNEAIERIFNFAKSFNGPAVRLTSTDGIKEGSTGTPPHRSFCIENNY